MKTTTSLKILLADDHEIFLDGMEAMLAKQPNIEVVGLATNGKECITLAEKTGPDIILTDIVMPGTDGIAMTKYLTEHYPAIGIIALSMFDQDSLIVDMLEAGARGYLLKNAHKSEILEAIDSVYQHVPYYCRSTTGKLAKLIGRSRYNPKGIDKAAEFSEKEREMIRLICEEKTTREIADLLFMSSRTVEGYRMKILEKMDVKSAVGIVVYAIKNGLYEVRK